MPSPGRSLPFRGLAPSFAAVVALAAGAGVASCSSAFSQSSDPPEVVARPPLQRLTRDQYDNTIRDLLGIGSQPSAAFAEDEEQAGYAANTQLPIQELQLTQYQQAAEKLAAQAVSSRFTAIVPCAPSASCADQFVRAFGKRAFRRPLADDEATAYDALFSSPGAAGDFAGGVRLVVATMLQSPNFLYRIEWGAPGARPESDGAIVLSQYEIASRLSYFLWNTMPDDALLAAAGAGQLATAEQVTAMARRMLADPKARDGIASFHLQWLQLQGLPTLEKTDPTFTTTLRTAMSDEIIAFVDAVVRQGDGDVGTLLTANFSFLEGPLYGLYGIAAPPGSPGAPTRTMLPANRAGVLTLPAVLAVHAHADQTSIVHRGLLVREQLLCSTIAPPPPNVDTKVPPATPTLTERQFMEEHAQNPACASCHDAMDSLGDAFEEFDAIGRFRTMDGTQPVDSTGQLTGTAGEDGPVAGAVDLARRLAGADEVRRCIALQWFRFLFGRVEGPGDDGTIASATRAFASAGYRIPDLMVAFTATRNFRYRTLIRTN